MPITLGISKLAPLRLIVKIEDNNLKYVKTQSALFVTANRILLAFPFKHLLVVSALQQMAGQPTSVRA